jgi:chemotaxis protein methyltransferase CheR
MNMQNPSLKTPTSEISFSDADYAAIAAFAKKRFGLDLQASKKPLVYSRLSKRLRALGLDNFEDYCRCLNTGEDADEESHLLSALTTNVTQFFREPHHFAFIREKFGPEIVARASAGKPVRIWSAACSTGEEAFSLAATLQSVLPRIDGMDVRILATDIDPVVIAKAESAIYPKDQLGQIPVAFRNQMLSPTASADHFEIKPSLRKLIRFGQLNLMSEWPMRNPFDLIMCRNAAIYFDKPTQSRLWQRFATCLHPGAHLMIGHSERLTGEAGALFDSVGVTTYRKRTAPQTHLPTSTEENT